MRQLKRKKVVRAHLEKQLEKTHRWIEKLSNRAYELRQAIERMDAIPKQEPYVKAKQEGN